MKDPSDASSCVKHLDIFVIGHMAILGQSLKRFEWLNLHYI